MVIILHIKMTKYFERLITFENDHIKEKLVKNLKVFTNLIYNHKTAAIKYT